VKVGGVLLHEVELPSGAWVDCAGECAKALREATEEFLDAGKSERK
jgi:hypothetical protein